MKGWKALGNKVGEYKILKIEHTNPPELQPEKEAKEKKEEGDLFSQVDKDADKIETKEKPSKNDDELKAGDSIDLDV